jgi:hypothetical protein
MQDLLEEEKTKIEDLVDHLKEYMSTSFEIVKLKAIEKGVTVASSTAAVMVSSVLFLFSLLFLSAGLALYLGNALGNSFYGFLIVGGIYLLLGIVINAGKKSFVGTPVSNALIKQLMKEDKE